MPLPTFHLGGFDLTDHSGLIYGCSVIAEGTSRGKPVPLNVAVKSWLQDGSIVVTQGYDNREVTLRVRFRAPNLTALAVAESALFAEMGKPNLLTWSPGNGPASVFVVVTSEFESAPAPSEDIAEQGAYPFRSYNLTLTCKAFVQSLEETVTPALPASGTTTTLVNNGSATTGWTGAVNGASTAPAVVSGAVKVTSSALPGTVVVAATLTASITTSSTKYLVVDWKPESAQGMPDLRAYGDGTELARAAQIGLASGLTRTWFGPVVAATIAVLRLESTSVLSPGILGFGETSVRSLAVDNINRTDAKPAIGTNRQLQRSIEVGGSAPTAGSLIISHETSALGDAAIFVWPSDPATDNHSPALRQYLIVGTASTDLTTISGAINVLASGSISMSYSIPATTTPVGLYTLVGRVKVGISGIGGAASLKGDASSIIGSTQVGAPSSIFDRPLESTGGAYVNMVLGRVLLPVYDVDTNSTAATQIDIFATLGGTSTITVDEMWLFGSFGQLIMVSCGTAAPSAGGSSNRVFIDPANVSRPRDVVRVGYAANGTDSHYPAGEFGSWQMPRVTPKRVNVLTACSNALDVAVAMRHTHTWHTHAAD